MSLEGQAKLVMALEDYKCEERKRWDERVDFIASDNDSDDMVLLRVITQTKSRSGVIGIDAVKKLTEDMELTHCERGVLIGNSFSNAAKREMDLKSIQRVSKKLVPSFKPQRLYIKIHDYVDELCKANCGKIPRKEADCKGYAGGYYSCKIRQISDNAAFHFEHGWANLLRHDLMRLLALQNSPKLVR